MDSTSTHCMYLSTTESNVQKKKRFIKNIDICKYTEYSLYLILLSHLYYENYILYRVSCCGQLSMYKKKSEIQIIYILIFILKYLISLRYVVYMHLHLPF